MKLTCAVVTCSDTRDIVSDEAGQALKKLIREQGWVCERHKVVRDEQESIERALRHICKEPGMDVIFTCGGTGFSTRDVTPEATIAVCDRMAPGIAEAIRLKSLEVTERAMLSRGVAGLRATTLIINFPGSTKAVKESFGFVVSQLEHAIDMLHGGKH